MKKQKKSVLVASALIAATCYTPAAYARHRTHAAKPPAASPTINAKGEFYATPVQAGDPAGALLGPGLIPGLDVAGGIANGATQPLLAIPDIANDVQPLFDIPTDIGNGIIKPLG